MPSGGRGSDPKEQGFPKEASGSRSPAWEGAAGLHSLTCGASAKRETWKVERLLPRRHQIHPDRHGPQRREHRSPHRPEGAGLQGPVWEAGEQAGSPERSQGEARRTQHLKTDLSTPCNTP